ncbi:crossover junction endodeoxyribonuclease RuvC [Olsenella profusa]|uniref:Crossover junction endodeoxyribonuclease RuvC n=1 Tax=Olsenella profusa F0195 TaxID=1125712 RepID=U2V694_9ACTN|nr:crossover junction endodeoxyribonuclease RuvC [Olsenella profusa F0195]
MVILGIDPGLAHTGWGIIETRGATCRTRAYGCIASDTSLDLARRLGRIYDEVSRVIVAYAPSELAIEKVFFGKNTRSAIATAHARGAAIVACAEAGLQMGEYTPMQIKQAVVGTGSADKRQVIFMVRTILSLDHDPRPDHCADALAAAVCHANLTTTQRVARNVASVAVFEAEQAQRDQARKRASEETAAATAAAVALRSAGPQARPAVSRARQSRRSTQ